MLLLWIVDVYCEKFEYFKVFFFFYIKTHIYILIKRFNYVWMHSVVKQSCIFELKLFQRLKIRVVF